MTSRGFSDFWTSSFQAQLRLNNWAQIGTITLLHVPLHRGVMKQVRGGILQTMQTAAIATWRNARSKDKTSKDTAPEFRNRSSSRATSKVASSPCTDGPGLLKEETWDAGVAQNALLQPRRGGSSSGDVALRGLSKCMVLLRAKIQIKNRSVFGS